MDIKEIYKIYLKHPEISTDSRENLNNKLFFALKGDNYNGNVFVKDALDNGAAYAIIDDKNYFIDYRTIYVDNSLSALQKLARFHRDQFDIPFIGITGTNGKTTTKELITSVLKHKYNVLATSGNFNNHIGVPLTILKVNRKTEIAIIEMGANHPGEISDLCKIANPDFGVITNIGKAHLEGFGSIDGVIKTKKELYDHLEAKNGKVFINSDNDLLKKICNAETIDYGSNSSSFISGKIVELNPYLKLSWNTTNNAPVFEIQSNLIGKYNFENALCAICIGKYFNVDDKKINQAICNYIPENNRSQIIKGGNNTIIMDCYNANPTSMHEALSSFSQTRTDLSKVLILGDMLELGEYKEAEHNKVIDDIKNYGFKKVFLVGKIFSGVEISDNFKSFNNNDSIIEYFKTSPLKNAFILIKGSRAMRLEKLLEYLK
ncbi:MAG: UDP-N-acetylmuramoyl-tripeptide--D-alanyl-D-alanine ligase [Bacteroidota bacterium]